MKPESSLARLGWSLRMCRTTLTICNPTVLDAWLHRVQRDVCTERLDWWSRTIVEDAQIDLRVEGRERIPQGETFVVMSNHQSYYDVPVLFRVVPKALRMVAKKELFLVPIFGAAMREAAFISIDRSNRERSIESLRYAGEVIRSGVHVWISPEGTRSRDGSLGPFKKGGFMLALDTHTRVLPIGLWGTHRVMSARSFLTHRGQRVGVSVGAPVSVEGRSRDELMAEVRVALQGEVDRAKVLAGPLNSSKPRRPRRDMPVVVSARSRSLLLWGMPGVGKSTLGPRLGARLGAPFVDLDRELERRCGVSVQECFARGEASFRALERETLRALLESPSPQVIALGGGALLEPELRRECLERAFVVTLVAPLELLASRVAQGPVRPLLGTDPETIALRLRSLWEARKSAYHECHLQLSSLAPLEELQLEPVVRAWQRPSLLMPLGERSYPIECFDTAEGLVAPLSSVEASAFAAFTDENVLRYHGATQRRLLSGRRSLLHPLQAGEEYKNLAALEPAWRALLESSIDRSALLLGWGGGTVTDRAGFLASTWMRGIRWAVVPTTLLAMVDAAVGGKTGVDFQQAKNLIGAFHQPIAVWSALDALSTEPRRSFVSGLAEVVKAALLGDARLFEWLEENVEAVLSLDLAALRFLVERAVQVKVRVVAGDEHEQGARALLNLGHTLGHALESAGGFCRLTHGEAISIGLVAELSLGASRGVGEEQTVERTRQLLTRLGLPTEAPRELWGSASAWLGHDKKRAGDRLRLPLVVRPGQARIEELPLTELEQAITSRA